MKKQKIYIAGCGGMLGESFYKIFNKDYILKCSDIDLNEKWLTYLDFRDLEIYRKDVDKNEIPGMKNDPDGYCKVWREFQTESKPASWLVWPYSRSKGWADQIIGYL